MKKLLRLHYIIVLFSFFMSCAKQEISLVESPNGEIKFSLNGLDRLSYDIDFRGIKIIKDSELGFILSSGEAFKNNLTCMDINTRTVNETYEILFGKRKIIRDQYTETVFLLKEKEVNERRMELQVRVYNDGVAFRYVFPEQPMMDSIIIVDESTNFAFTKDAEAFYLPRPDYDTNYEGPYSVSPLTEVPVTLIGVPILLKYSENLWVGVTEANLTDYAGMYLSKTQGLTPAFISSLSPYPGKNGIKVLGKIPFKTPWRVIMLADRPGRLIESDIIVNLNEPCRIEDTSWIKPGKSTWHWWNGTVLKNVDFEPGMNFQTMKHYIDFCAANRIEFHSLVEFKGPWYDDPNPNGWEPGPTADVTRARPELQMEKLIEYAKEKNVGLRLWVHWKALNKKMEEAFRTYQKWGIKSLMVDFMDRDDQEMVNFYHQCLQEAAKYHLTIQFHGAYKPTGIRRTYPNLITTEAVMNTEWGRMCTPEHNLIVPFTRMLAGPMDYHLGCFRSAPQNGPFKNNVYGTRCHQLAMYVVYESYLQLLCDYPSAYEGQPGFDFVKKVPTVWDDIKVLNDEVANYITIARRSGKDWYIGSMTDWTARQIKISLSFLPDGIFRVEIYSDAGDSGLNPDHLQREVRLVTNKDTIRANLSSGGGQVMFLEKQEM
jgi:alpha-glucosidase